MVEHKNTKETKELEQHEVHDVLKFLEAYGKPIALAVTLALVVYIGVSVHRHHRQQQRITAASLLDGAQSMDDLQLILDEFSNTPAATAAAFEAGTRLFREGRTELAMERYKEFVATYPESDQTPLAWVAQANCAEVLGQLEAAVEACDHVLEQYAEHYAAPLAALSRARCLGALKRFDESVAAYEEVVTDYPGTPWASQADMARQFVEQRRRAAAVSSDEA